MKRILLTLAIFLVVFVAADRIFTFIFSKQIFSKTLSGESGGSLNYLLKKKKNIDFLILGSSRAKHQIDPALLTNVYKGNGYNAGINGVGTIVYNSVLLDILIQNKVVPKMVILQTDKYQLTHSESKAGTEVVPLYPFINQSSLMENYISFQERCKLLIQAYRYNGKFLNVVFNYLKRNSVKDNTGYVDLREHMDSLSVRKIAPKPASRLVLSQDRMKALQSIVELCKKHDIKLVVVFPPVYNNAGYDEKGNEQLYAAMRGEGVPNILNFSDIHKLPMLEPASMWKDADHLNYAGAAIFSKALNESVASML